MVKIKTKKVISASGMKEIPKNFWDWFFCETSFGNTNIIDVNDEDDFGELQTTINYIKEKYKKYSYLEHGCKYIEIENDL
jgi:hypothetical protein